MRCRRKCGLYVSLPYCDENELIELGLTLQTARAIARIVNQSDYVVQIGTGSPAGVLKSNKSRFYIDSSVPTLYFNPNIEDDSNWQAL